MLEVTPLTRATATPTSPGAALASTKREVVPYADFTFMRRTVSASHFSSRQSLGTKKRLVGPISTSMGPRSAVNVPFEAWQKVQGSARSARCGFDEQRVVSEHDRLPASERDGLDRIEHPAVRQLLLVHVALQEAQAEAEFGLFEKV